MSAVAEKLTHEEHEARAMLLGMHYHHGNGDPFYYKDLLDLDTFVDANTLEPLTGSSITDAHITAVLDEKGKAHGDILKRLEGKK